MSRDTSATIFVLQEAMEQLSDKNKQLVHMKTELDHSGQQNQSLATEVCKIKNTAVLITVS